LRVESKDLIIAEITQNLFCKFSSQIHSELNEDRYAPVRADGAGVSPRAQAQPDDRGPGGVESDHPGAPGRSAAVPTEAECEMKNYCIINL